ncbi:MAG: hypothetical protein ACKO5K_00870 [Armatimonadota bacterium]
MYTRFLPVVVVAALLVGCAAKEETAPSAGTGARIDPPPPAQGSISPPSAPGTPAGGPGRGPGGPGGAPGGGGFMAAMAPPPKPAPNAPLAPTPKEDQAIVDAEKSGDKAAIAKAYLERAVKHRIDDKAGDKVKFPAVLDDIAKALEADPANDRARKLEKFVRSMMQNNAKAAGAPAGK